MFEKNAWYVEERKSWNDYECYRCTLGCCGYVIIYARGKDTVFKRELAHSKIDCCF